MSLSRNSHHDSRLNSLRGEDPIPLEVHVSNALTSLFQWALSRKSIVGWMVTHEQCRIALIRWVALILGFKYPFSVVAIVSVNSILFLIFKLDSELHNFNQYFALPFTFCIVKFVKEMLQSKLIASPLAFVPGDFMMIQLCSLLYWYLLIHGLFIKTMTATMYLAIQSFDPILSALLSVTLLDKQVQKAPLIFSFISGTSIVAYEIVQVQSNDYPFQLKWSQNCPSFIVIIAILLPSRIIYILRGLLIQSILIRRSRTLKMQHYLQHPNEPIDDVHILFGLDDKSLSMLDKVMCNSIYDIELFGPDMITSIDLLIIGEALCVFPAAIISLSWNNEFNDLTNWLYDILLSNPSLWIMKTHISCVFLLVAHGCATLVHIQYSVQTLITCSLREYVVIRLIITLIVVVIDLILLDKKQIEILMLQYLLLLPYILSNVCYIVTYTRGARRIIHIDRLKIEQETRSIKEWAQLMLESFK